MNRISEFQKHGVVCYSQFVSRNMLIKYHDCLRDIVTSYVSELNCTQKEYLTSVSRWASPSKMTDIFDGLVNDVIKLKLESLFNKSIDLVKHNVICKNQYSNQPIPCHQDISYPQKTSYDFSCWLSLSDINHDDGALKCLPEEQFSTIDPAVDFWDPDFLDKKARSREWFKKAVTFPVKIGDAILFKSIIWHASLKNTSGNFRYALVTRWKIQDKENMYQIPEKVDAKFGMWTCRKKTEVILHALLVYYGVNPDVDFAGMLQQVIVLLPKLNWLSNSPESESALKQVMILHIAAEKHNGGDSQGNIYQNLWHLFLKQVESYLSKCKEKNHEYQ